MNAHIGSTERTLAHATDAVNYVRLTLQRDQEALRAIGFERTADDFAAWNRMSTQAQNEAQLEAVQAAVSVGINALRAFLSSGKSLNPFNVNKYIQDNNIQNKYAQRLIRDVSHIQNKPESFEKLSSALEHVDNMKDGAMMEQVSDVLGLLIGDPTLSLVVSDAKVLAADGYAAAATYTASQEIERLRGLSELQLKGWQSVNRAMLDHVAQLKSATRLQNQAGLASNEAKQSYQTTCSGSAAKPPVAPKLDSFKILKGCMATGKACTDRCFNLSNMAATGNCMLTCESVDACMRRSGIQ